jgi:hypothetical protein
VILGYTKEVQDGLYCSRFSKIRPDMAISGMECSEEIQDIPEIDRKILEKCMEIWGRYKEI